MIQNVYKFSTEVLSGVSNLQTTLLVTSISGKIRMKERQYHSFSCETHCASKFGVLSTNFCQK